MARTGDSTELAVPRRRLSSGKYAVLVAPFVLALVVVVVGGYLLHWHWTGYLSPEQGHTPRTLWDWLSLLLQPLVLAFVPVYFKLRGRGSAVWPVVLLGGALILGVLVAGGYASGWRWTGFEGNTLWDWLGLFLVPFLLPLALVFLDVELEHRRGGATLAQTPPRLPPEQGGWSPLRTTLVAGGLVLAGFVGGWVAHIQAHDAAPPSTLPSTGSPGELDAVTVDAADPNWTDTHLTVTKGQRLEISAFGLARSSAGHAATGPRGEQGGPPAGRTIVSAFPHMALLATVAPPGTQVPLEAGALRQGVVDVGPHRIFTAPASGELLLGVNDAGPGNNHGWFGATVRR